MHYQVHADYAVVFYGIKEGYASRCFWIVPGTWSDAP